MAVASPGGPLPGPPSEPATARTEFSPVAAPRAVSAALQEDHALVRWEASCPRLPRPTGYKVRLCRLALPRCAFPTTTFLVSF